MNFDRWFLVFLGILVLVVAVVMGLLNREGFATALLGAGMALVGLGMLLGRLTRVKLPGGFEAEIQELRKKTEGIEKTTDRIEQRTEEVAARNDLFWENVRANAEIALRQQGNQGVRLRGGPMDSWFVSMDAPALEPDWCKTWPSSVRARNAPGRYILSESGTWAEWQASPG